MTGDEREEVTRLLAENRRLRELLSEHGIAWQPRDITPSTDRSPRLGTDEKVRLFASLLTSMRERVAGRHLREAADQVRRLRAPCADPGHGPDGLRPPRRPAHRRGVSAPDR